MSEAFAGGSGRGDRAAAALGLADRLGFAAAPTFAIMALLTGVPGGDGLSVVCGSAHEVSLLGGMVPMYLLMSAFHSMPWLKLISRRRGAPTFDRMPPS